MKKSLCIPAAVFYYVVSFAFSNEIQVGTVLFTKTDLVKKCWSENDKALLRARLIMQGRLHNNYTPRHFLKIALIFLNLLLELPFFLL